MTLIRWAVSIDDGTGKRVMFALDINHPEIYITRERARAMCKEYRPSYKPRVERVVIEIEGVE